ncbi:hypothetical protein K470DRAFT_269223 [Piedraia hortae CBS 480.64]|uniref:Uncharacterized protein n=1 Tax=Piedraia hortae CBS 480.64 TaxID=1314780 RepID=A0A6A7C5B3_9PEZI|nr:hypothetical protein K470DRAFT_269223 [Piedraia hortae CBS 480.64]
MTGNPFRGAGNAHVVSSEPEKTKKKKRVVIQTPPRSPEEPRTRSHSFPPIAEDSHGNTPELTLSRTETDPVTPLETDANAREQTGGNPFARLAVKRQPSSRDAGAPPGAKQILDVDAFKDMLLGRQQDWTQSPRTHVTTDSNAHLASQDSSAPKHTTSDQMATTLGLRSPFYDIRNKYLDYTFRDDDDSGSDTERSYLMGAEASTKLHMGSPTPPRKNSPHRAPVVTTPPDGLVARHPLASPPLMSPALMSSPMTSPSNLNKPLPPPPPEPRMAHRNSGLNKTSLATPNTGRQVTPSVITPRSDIMLHDSPLQDAVDATNSFKAYQKQPPLPPPSRKIQSAALATKPLPEAPTFALESPGIQARPNVSHIVPTSGVYTHNTAVIAPLAPPRRRGASKSHGEAFPNLMDEKESNRADTLSFGSLQQADPEPQSSATQSESTFKGMPNLTNKDILADMYALQAEIDDLRSKEAHG